MNLIYIIGITYVALICITIICMLIEHIAVWRIRKLLILLGVEKINIGAHATLWKKIMLAPFIAWLFPMFIKSMYHTNSYYRHLNSLPKEHRKEDYENEVKRMSLAGTVELIINKKTDCKKEISIVKDDGIPF